MKKIFVLAMFIGLNSYAQDFGRLINQGINIVNQSQVVNCNAIYRWTGYDFNGSYSRQQTISLRARSAGEACARARSENQQGHDFNGSYSKTLSLLNCTDVLGRSFFVNIQSCRKVK
jgi:hypothetical protein